MNTTPAKIDSLQRRVEGFGFKDGETLYEVCKRGVVHFGMRKSVLLRADIQLNGESVPMHEWENIRLYSGDEVVVYADTGGKVGAILGAILIAVALTIVSYGAYAGLALSAFGKFVVSASLMAGGALVQSSLSRKPRMSMPGIEAKPDIPVYSIQGASNSFRAYEPLACVVGTHRVVFDKAQEYYSVIQNNIQKIRHIFCVCAGDAEILDIRKETTHLESLGMAVKVWRNWRGEQLWYFSRKVNSLSENFKTGSTPFISQSPVNTVGFGCISVFVGGLYRTKKDSGKKESISVDFVYYFYNTTTGQSLSYSETYSDSSDPKQQQYRVMAYRDLSVGVWQVNVYAYYLKVTSVLVSKKINVNIKFDYYKKEWSYGDDSYLYYYAGYYKVQTFIRTSGYDRGSFFYEDVLVDYREYETVYERWNAANFEDGDWIYTIDSYVTEVQWHQNEQAITYNGRSQTLIEIEATASEKLSGALSTINGLVRRLGKNPYSGALEYSSNCASQAYRLLTDRDICENTELAEIDIESFQRFHAHCEKYGFTADFVETSGPPLGQVLARICEVGQGYISMPMGRITVYFDDPSQPKVDTLTPRTSWGLTISKQMPIKPIDGLRVMFSNASKDYQQDERLVTYRPGITPQNVQILQATAVTSADSAYKYGMLALARIWLRGRTFTFYTDWRSIDYALGQKIGIQHPAFFMGIGTAGKIIDYLKDDAGYYHSIVLDQYYPVTAGKTYALEEAVKYSNRYWYISNFDSEETNILRFDVPIQPLIAPKIGTLMAFGEVGKVTVDVLIKEITRQADYAALIEAIPADDIYPAISGTVPPFESALTTPTYWDRDKPYTPVITECISDESAATLGSRGKIIVNANLAISYREKHGVTWDYYIVLYKKTTETEYKKIIWDKGKSLVVLSNVEQDGEYSVEIAAVSKAGMVSDYSTAQITIFGLKNPPPPPKAVLVGGTKIIIQMNEPYPIDVVGWEIRMSMDDSDPVEWAIRLTDTYTRSKEFDIEQWSGWSRRVWVRTVDYIGLTSEWISVAINLGDVPVQNVLFEISEKARPWPGEVVSGSLINGCLIANDAAPFWGDEPFWG